MEFLQQQITRQDNILNILITITGFLTIVSVLGIFLYIKSHLKK